MLRRHLHRLRTRWALPLGASLAMGATGATGCSQKESLDAGIPTRASLRVALAFTRAPEAPGDVPNLRFEAQGHFARYATADADLVPTMLGVPSDGDIPLDGCRVMDPARDLDRALASLAADVELLDAGRVSVKGPIDGAPLSAKHYPELTPYVAGVVYGAPEGPAVALEPGATYEVSGDGGEQVGPFSTQVAAPRAFPSLERPTYRPGADLDLRWREPGPGEGDSLVISVAWSSRAGASEVRCHVRDDGAFAVPRELLSAMPPARQVAIAEVTATRIRQVPLTAQVVTRAPGGGAPERTEGHALISLRDVQPLLVVGSGEGER